MNQRHKWADVIIAWANGETIQYMNTYGKFQNLVGNGKKCNPINRSEVEWRIKPRTIMIGDMEVPEPLRAVPKNGTGYYVVSLFAPPSRKIWGYYDYQYKWLSMGLVHLDRDAAIVHGKALVKVSGGTI